MKPKKWTFKQRWKSFKRGFVAGTLIGASALVGGKLAEAKLARRPMPPVSPPAIEAPAEKPVQNPVQSQRSLAKPVEKKAASAAKKKAVAKPFLQANDFLAFRAQQAKRFGIELTSKAADKAGFFQPSVSLMKEIKGEISMKCKAFNADRSLVYSIIEHESHFNPNAKSKKHARGLGS